MIRKKKDRPIVIDLTGPQGNAFALLGAAARFGRQLGYSNEELESMLDDMKSSDYEHLIEVFDNHFGSVVILER